MKNNKENGKNNIISLRSGKSKLAAAGLLSLFIGTSAISAFRTSAVAQISQTENKKPVVHVQASAADTAASSGWSDQKLSTAESQKVSPEAVARPLKMEMTTAAGEKEAEKNAQAPKKTKRVFQPLVKEGKSVDDSYFDDALFIGASRTQGFQNLSGLARGSYLTEIGINVKDVFTKKIRFGKDKIEICKAVEDGSFGKVYVMFGINEVGWPYLEEFIEEYRKVIQMIKKAQPEAVVYVQSIIQCSKEKAAKDKAFGKKNINRFNKQILKMCKEEKVYFLQLNDVMTDSEGYLPSDVTTDGVHMNQGMCKKWLSYLKSHTAAEA